MTNWTDARVGDPALDFAALLDGFGASFAADLFDAYEHERDPTLTDRARFYRLIGPWHEVTYGLSRERPQYVDTGLAGIRERLD